MGAAMNSSAGREQVKKTQAVMFFLGLPLLFSILFPANARAQSAAASSSARPIELLPPPVFFGISLRGQERLPAPKGTEAFSLPDPYSIPDPARVFRLESEPTLFKRMARESRLGYNILGLKYETQFPVYPPEPKEVSLVRRWAPLTELAEPGYVCYRRLYFEQINLERYGWDFCLLTPFLSLGAFYFDLVALPYHAGEDLFRRYECNTGYPLPGDPVPFMIYKPEWSWTGAAAEATAVGLIIVAFP
jgi:hypothetical protein